MSALRGALVAAAIFAASFLFPIASSGAAAWESGNGFRRLRVEPGQSGKPGFVLLKPEQTGISFSNILSDDRMLSSQILPSGSGVAAGDVDGDGLCDLYFCSLGQGNHLYRNRGNWKFENITSSSGVACAGMDCTAAALVDLDGDGDLDLVVNTLGKATQVFANAAKGRFSAVATLNQGKGGMSLAVADTDGDGFLDIYITNYRVKSAMDDPGIRFGMRMIDGKPTVVTINGKPITDPEWTNRFEFHITTGPQGGGKFAYDERGEADVLYRNTGELHFAEIAFTSGSFLDEEGKPLATPPYDWGLTAAFRDLNGDGSPDLYVCNDFRTSDRLWLNDGKGHFRAAPRTALRHVPLSSMSVDFADVNHDGHEDFFVGEMLSRDHRRRLSQRNNIKPDPLTIGIYEDRPQYARNCFQLARGDGSYAEIAQYSGLDASEWSWTPLFVDVDLDGYEDLLVCNGFVRDNMNMDAVEAYEAIRATQRNSTAGVFELRRMFPPLATPNVAFRNLGNLTFAEVGHQWGFDTPVISHGACLADLDNDGDADVIANNLGAPAGVYCNQTASPRLAVRLKGLAPNTRGIGSQINVHGGAVPLQTQELTAAGRYLSSDEPMRYFAAGSSTNKLRIEVNWRSGRRSVITGVEPGFIYEIDEAQASPVSPRIQPAPVRPLFEDVSSRLAHLHHETPFDDFALQPSLTKKLSQLGPGVCWADLNGDGWDDLAVTGGKGGMLALYLNDGKEGFKRQSGRDLNRVLERDGTAVLAFSGGSGPPKLLMTASNYEDHSPAAVSVLEIDPRNGTVAELIPGESSTASTLALADVDGDGDLDLFVGGRLLPGRYPSPARSRLFRNQDDKFILDEANSKRLDAVGMVSSAVWSDLDSDGFPELLLACEWGPIRVFHNSKGSIEARELAVSGAVAIPGLPGTNLHLSTLTGWWTGITTADIDADGRLDIIAGNWGRNCSFESRRTRPFRIYYGDFNQDGSTGMIETSFGPDTNHYMPERRLDLLGPAFPWLRGRFPTHASFAGATIEDVLRDRVDSKKSAYLEAACFESMLFLNRPEGLSPVLLPQEAQFSPAFALVAADFNGDGAEDVFLSQNFFAVDLETSRFDAGRGLLLTGDGKGALRAVPGLESGIRIYGEQRGAAAADFDADGRTDLVVTQNAADTRLLKNVRAEPGLRVRLKGPPRNPQGIGAQIRLKHGTTAGPVREVHGGSGYLSQDSPVQVLGKPRLPAQLSVLWPGGNRTTSDVPAEAKEIELDFNGSVRVLK